VELLQVGAAIFYSTGGAGGTGSANSISGCPVSYAGGGGGGSHSAGQVDQVDLEVVEQEVLLKLEWQVQQEQLTQVVEVVVQDIQL
jgi:hypothetical protein